MTLFELQVPHEKITAQTGVSRSGLYKLRPKAISRGWDPLGILETWHVRFAVRTKNPVASLKNQDTHSTQLKDMSRLLQEMDMQLYQRIGQD